MHTAHDLCTVVGQHTTHLLFHITGCTALGTISHNSCTQCQLRSDTSSSRIQIPNSRSRARPSRSASSHVGGGIIVSSTSKSSTESRYIGRGTRRAGAAVRHSRPFSVAGSVGFAMSRAHIACSVVCLEPNRLRHYPTAARSRHESTCTLISLWNAEPWANSTHTISFLIVRPRYNGALLLQPVEREAVPCVPGVGGTSPRIQ